MKIHLSRAVIAVGLGASLWFGTVSSFAAPQQTKDQGQSSSTTSQSSQSDQKSNATQAPAQQASKKGPLATNEDPEMIGKRNINKGLWGKLVASGPFFEACCAG